MASLTEYSNRSSSFANIVNLAYLYSLVSPFSLFCFITNSFEKSLEKLNIVLIFIPLLIIKAKLIVVKITAIITATIFMFFNFFICKIRNTTPVIIINSFTI